MEYQGVQDVRGSSGHRRGVSAGLMDSLGVSEGLRPVSMGFQIVFEGFRGVSRRFMRCQKRFNSVSGTCQGSHRKSEVFQEDSGAFLRVSGFGPQKRFRWSHVFSRASGNVSVGFRDGPRAS